MVGNIANNFACNLECHIMPRHSGQFSVLQLLIVLVDIDKVFDPDIVVVDAGVQLLVILADGMLVRVVPAVAQV